jgi:hypothetical protein
LADNQYRGIGGQEARDPLLGIEAEGARLQDVGRRLRTEQIDENDPLGLLRTRAATSAGPSDRAPAGPSPDDPLGLFAQRRAETARREAKANESRTWGEAAADLATSYASGAGAMVENIGRVGALATGDDENALTNLGESARTYWDARKSTGLKLRERRRAAAIERAPTQVGKAVAAVGETLLDPALLSSWLSEQVTMLLPSAAAGRAAGVGARALGAGEKAVGNVALGAAVSTGAAQQGADVGGDTYDGLMKMSPDLWGENAAYRAFRDSGMGDGEARHAVALELARDAALQSAMVSAATNLIPGSRVLERALVGAKTPTRSKLKSMALGAFGESAQEMVEEGSGRAISNLAQQNVDPSIPTSQGVGEAAGMALPAGLFGAAGGLARPAVVDAPAQEDQAPPQVEPDAVPPGPTTGPEAPVQYEGGIDYVPPDAPQGTPPPTGRPHHRARWRRRHGDPR